MKRLDAALKINTERESTPACRQLVAVKCVRACECACVFTRERECRWKGDGEGGRVGVCGHDGGEGPGTRGEKNISGADSQALAGASTHTSCRKSLTSPLITLCFSKTHTHTTHAPIKEACMGVLTTYHDQKDSWHAMRVSTAKVSLRATFTKKKINHFPFNTNVELA